MNATRKIFRDSIAVHRLISSVLPQPKLKDHVAFTVQRDVLQTMSKTLNAPFQDLS